MVELLNLYLQERTKEKKMEKEKSGVSHVCCVRRGRSEEKKAIRCI